MYTGQTHTHTHSEWITISTQFNEKCRPISKMCAHFCHPPPFSTSSWGALGKLVHFQGVVGVTEGERQWSIPLVGPKNNMFSKRHFHLCCMLCTHFRKCIRHPPTTPHPTPHRTFCTYLRSFRNCNWVGVSGFSGWRTTYRVHCLFPFCGAQIGTFAVSTNETRALELQLIGLPNWCRQSNG